MQNISLSVNDLLACCGFLCGQGCNGGYPISAWRYFKHHGVVTEEVSFSFWLQSSRVVNKFLSNFCNVVGSFSVIHTLTIPDALTRDVNPHTLHQNVWGNVLVETSFGVNQNTMVLALTKSVMTLKTLWQKFTKMDL